MCRVDFVPVSAWFLVRAEMFRRTTPANFGAETIDATFEEIASVSCARSATARRSERLGRQVGEVGTSGSRGTAQAARGRSDEPCLLSLAGSQARADLGRTASGQGPYRSATVDAEGRCSGL